MRSFPVATSRTGAYITPHEVNAELAELAGTVNSLDLYNFAAANLTAEKLDLGATGNIHIDAFDTTNTTATTDDTIVRAIPDDGDADWAVNFDSGDCVLHISSSGWVQSVSGLGTLFIAVGVRVDGEILVMQPLQGSNTFVQGNVWAFEADIAVGAGTHVVEMIYHGVLASGFLSLSEEYDWGDRTLVIREVAR